MIRRNLNKWLNGEKDEEIVMDENQMKRMIMIDQ